MDWLAKAKKEIEPLAQAMFENFKFAMNNAVRHCPDQTNIEQRARVFELVVQFWIGGFINPIATFANTSQEIEDMVIQEIRLKFQWIRDHEKELQIERLNKVAENKGLAIGPVKE